MSREAAFLALCAAHRGSAFLAESLEKWRRERHPSQRDFHLAQEMAFGTERRLLSLDYLAKQLASNKTLSLKWKEKILLRLALYQFYFLDRIPLYAISNEMMQLAKRYCHPRFLGFYQAIMRKLPQHSLQLPQGKGVQELSVTHSFPEGLIASLLQEYGLEKTEEMLQIFNRPPVIMARERKTHQAILVPSSAMLQIAASPDHYIQNRTSIELLLALRKQAPMPKKILDLCAAPGGKLLAVHDFFPEAELYAYDISSARLEKLRENIQKYGLNVRLGLPSAEERFDLILLDVPCSNSGVLHKRPEARWRDNDLTATQWELLQQARSYLSPGGEIWYMTCSILQKENEQQVDKATRELALALRDSLKILPSVEGHDGGYAARLMSNG